MDGYDIKATIKYLNELNKEDRWDEIQVIKDYIACCSDHEVDVVYDDAGEKVIGFKLTTSEWLQRNHRLCNS